MNINLTGYINTTSYGLVILNVCNELTKLGHKVSLFGQFSDDNIPAHFHDSIRVSLENAKFFDYTAPSVRIAHQFDLAQHIITTANSYGWPIFELDKFNAQELHHLKSQDCLIVCSDWAEKICRENGIKQQIHVVPLGVDISIFRYAPKKFPEKTVFINVGKKEVRKGHAFILDCFEQAFSPKDNVELWMVWGNRILDNIKEPESAAWTDLYYNSPMSDKIKTQWKYNLNGEVTEGYNMSWEGYKDAAVKGGVTEWLPTQNHLVNLFNKADCGVFPSLAEGFDLDLLEAMACGLPVVTTNYSAHTQFCNTDNAYLIEPEILEDAYDGTWFHGQGKWMAFGYNQRQQLIEYMRSIHKRKQDGDTLFNTCGVQTAEKFTWKATAQKLLEVLQ